VRRKLGCEDKCAHVAVLREGERLQSRRRVEQPGFLDASWRALPVCGDLEFDGVQVVVESRGGLGSLAWFVAGSSGQRQGEQADSQQA
jgi:hypothetical protein